METIQASEKNDLGSYLKTFEDSLKQLEEETKVVLQTYQSQILNAFKNYLI